MATADDRSAWSPDTPIPALAVAAGPGAVTARPTTATATTTTTTTTTATEPEPASRRRLRQAGVVLVVALLVGAIVVRRDTITAAVAEIGRLPVAAILALVALASYERWSRADIVARLLGDVRTRDGFVVHDVGNAASKGLPMGGALGTALRWSIVREREIGSTRFATMLVAYGVATTFVTWLLPLAALGIDVIGRPMTATDGLIAIVLGVGVLAQLGLWYVLLGSDRVGRWSSRFAGGVCRRAAGRVPSLQSHDAGDLVADVRGELRLEARRALPLLVRTGFAQACGSVILLVSLRGLGVGGELETSEFFRVFFVTHLLGTFAPTPGGVGVVEAGLTGALVAAGVDPSAALAGVLVYRFATYIVPILTGTVLYLAWRRQRLQSAPVAPVRDGGVPGGTLATHGASIHTPLPDVPRTADQGLRQR